jgi:5-methyltetrahydropteroyltriglutamate--homocysteine methyltransferase
MPFFSDPLLSVGCSLAPFPAVRHPGGSLRVVLGRSEAGALNSLIRPDNGDDASLSEVLMAYGFDRFLTTHTGSLPRPDDLIRAMFAKEEGVPVDRAALAAWISKAVAEVVKKQVVSGVDLVNDGEMSKPSYATYVKDRLTGFAGTSNTFVYQDLAEFPNLAKRVFSDPGRSRRRTPACTGPIAVGDPAAPLADIANLKAALTGVDAAGAFLSAASPGVISLFFRNDHYPSQEAYLFAIAEAMRGEYEAIAAAGVTVQIDCPDLAMGRHIQYADLSVAEFRNRARLHVEALNHALAAIPPERVRMHLCWGNYEGPHHCDVPLAEIIDIAFAARPTSISFEAANPRHAHEWTLFEQVKLPEGKIIIPGVIESKSNFIEHPELIAQRIARYANLVGRDNVIAGSDCGFGTWVGQAAVDPDVVWAKLSAMAEGARLATKQFWGG